MNIEKIKLFGRAILHDWNNERGILEPSQKSMREHFCKNS